MVPEQVAGQEAGLIGGRAVEPLAGVDVEVADRVVPDLGARRLAGGLEHQARRGQVVVVADAEQDGAADFARSAPRPVTAETQGDPR